MDKVLIHATTWRNLRDVLSENPQIQKNKYSDSMNMNCPDRQIYADRKIGGCLRLGRGVGWVVTAHEYGVSF